MDSSVEAEVILLPERDPGNVSTLRGCDLLFVPLLMVAPLWVEKEVKSRSVKSRQAAEKTCRLKTEAATYGELMVVEGKEGRENQLVP